MHKTMNKACKPQGEETPKLQHDYLKHLYLILVQLYRKNIKKKKIQVLSYSAFLKKHLLTNGVSTNTKPPGFHKV